MFKRFALLLSVLCIALSSVALADVDINSSIPKIDVKFNDISQKYTVGVGKDKGVILVLPANHIAMDITIGSEGGSLDLVMYGYDNRILWESSTSGFNWKTYGIQRDEMETYYCGDDVAYILIYHYSEYKDSQEIKTAKFWYQGANERVCY